MFKNLSWKNIKGNVKLISVALVILMLMQMLIIIFVASGRRVERFNDTAAKAFTASSVTMTEMLDNIKEIVLTTAAERDVNYMMLSDNVSLSDMQNFRRTIDLVRNRMIMKVKTFYVYNEKTNMLYGRGFEKVKPEDMPDTHTKAQIMRSSATGDKMVIFADTENFLTDFQGTEKVLRFRYFPGRKSNSCIIADVSMSRIAEVFEDYMEEFSAEIFIMDTAGKLLYGSGENPAMYVEKDMDYIKNANFSSPVLRRYGDEKYLILRQYSQKTGMYMLSLIPNSAIKVDLSETQTLLYTNLSLVIALLVVLILFFVIKWINETAKENLRRQQMEEETGRYNRLMRKKQYLINCLFKPDDHDIRKAKEYIADLAEDCAGDSGIWSRVSVLRLEICAYDNFIETYSNRDIHLYKYGIANICEETLNNHMKAIAVYERDAGMIYLVPSGDTAGCRRAFAECQAAVDSYVGLKLSAMLSSEGEFEDLPDLYKETQQLSEYSFMLEGPVFLEAKILDSLASADDKVMNERLDSVCADLAQGGREELGRLYDWLRCLNLTDAKNVMWMLMFRLFNIGKRNGRSLGNIDSLAAQFNSLKSLTDMKQFFAHLIALVFSGEKDIEQTKDNDTVQKVLDVVERRFREPNFCSDDVAADMNLSKAYLSRKYKQATGSSILETINERRMEAFASELLTTDKSVKSIIEEVGGVNHNYYMMMFKKKYSMTPTEYRQEFKLQVDK
ncbi:MAG: AraC family transcriptional regulator [Clostridia bacterium]|nr:AraC family transcriptional regulator [Clostridia bacterium]